MEHRWSRRNAAPDQMAISPALVAMQANAESDQAKYTGRTQALTA